MGCQPPGALDAGGQSRSPGALAGGKVHGAWNRWRAQRSLGGNNGARWSRAAESPPAWTPAPNSPGRSLQRRRRLSVTASRGWLSLRTRRSGPHFRSAISTGIAPRGAAGPHSPEGEELLIVASVVPRAHERCSSETVASAYGRNMRSLTVPFAAAAPAGARIRAHLRPSAADERVLWGSGSTWAGGLR
jgi:hypothetical protein